MIKQISVVDLLRFGAAEVSPWQSTYFVHATMTSTMSVQLYDLRVPA